ncbi:MAG: hypothetical protein RLZZ419_1221, partial [Pseudomonadota bacterium]
DSQVQPFMPERESSENSLTSRHLSDKPDGMKLRSDSVANGYIISELDTKSKTSLHSPPEVRGFTDSLVNHSRAWPAPTKHNYDACEYYKAGLIYCELPY